MSNIGVKLVAIIAIGIVFFVLCSVFWDMARTYEYEGVTVLPRQEATGLTLQYQGAGNFGFITEGEEVTLIYKFQSKDVIPALVGEIPIISVIGGYTMIAVIIVGYAVICYTVMRRDDGD